MAPVVLPEKIHTNGIVKPSLSTSLSFNVTGFIEAIYVDEGDWVKKGQPLASLDRRDLQRVLDLSHARVKRREAILLDVENEYQRQVSLMSKGQTSEKEYLKSQANKLVAAASLVEAKVQLQQADDALSDATFYAPFDGYVGERFMEPHEYTTVNTPILSLLMVDPIVIRANLPVWRVRSLRVGDSGTVLSDISGQEILGVVTRIGASTDNARSVPFELEVRGDGTRYLVPGQPLGVVVESKTQVAKLALPTSAVLKDIALRPFCFVVAETDKRLYAVKRYVSVGALNGDLVVVDEGLVEGDLVVVEGQHFLSEGQQVSLVGDGA